MDRISAYDLRVVTEATARVAYDWIERGDKGHGDQAAIETMHAELLKLPLNGNILIGEGPQEEISILYTGEPIGDSQASRQYDIVVDPIEGTTYMAKGLTNAMAVMAMAPKGTLFDPGPAYYMEKFVGPPEVKGQIDPEAPVADKLSILAKAVDKKLEELAVYVIDKPRHRDLIAAIRAAGARVALYPAGDVAGAVAASIPESEIDCLMGTGGIPEGMLAACAIRALGGEMFCRIDPQLAAERMAVEDAGFDLDRWYSLEELVRSDQTIFCATGIATGLLFEGIERSEKYERTQTMMIAGNLGERQLLTSFHRCRRIS
jgi:fructose-1,6-bisphosphatase II